MNVYLIAVVAGFLSCFVNAEVTILNRVQTIYDRSPSLRLKGENFNGDISVALAASGEQPLRADVDFMLSKTYDSIVLKLLAHRTWVDFSQRHPPVALVLSSVSHVNNTETNLLSHSLTVANVLATPIVNESSEVIFQSATNNLVIRGSGFVGARYVNLYFDPPLLKDISYEVASRFPLSENEIVLRIRHGYQWRRSLGPLSVVGIDTGGGPLKLNGDIGVKVAEVSSLEANNK